jgi:hypothetical protein
VNKNTITLIKKHMLIMGALLCCICGVYAQNVGDYRANSGTPTISNAAGWQIYNGNGWVTATVAPINQQPSPFANDIYINTNNMIVDSNYIHHGDIINSKKRKITVSSGCTFEFGLDQNSLFDLCLLTVEAGGRFINNGTMKSLGSNSLILLEGGATPGSGGILENRCIIETEGKIEQENYSTIISCANGVIRGKGRIDVNADGAAIIIANPGGYDEAVQVTGNQNIYHACITFNGVGNQKSGKIPSHVFKVTVAEGTNLTLTDNVTLIDRHHKNLDIPTFTVEGGATLDTGNFVISTDKNNNHSVAQFVLEEDATIVTSNAEGISSDTGNGNQIASGAIQTNSAYYSSGANYIFNGTGPNGRQYSGDFETVPQTNTVNIIINESNSMLLLDDSFYPLTATTGYQGNINTQTGIGEGYILGQTLPVEMSYFNAIYNGFNSVMLQWETQSETNNLGFYVLRAKEAEASQALLVSALIPAANTSQGAVYCFEDKDLYDDGIYYYWLQDVSFSGSVELHGPAIVQVTLNAGSNQTPDIPMKTSLVRNYPNPFNPSTQFEYYLEKGSDVDFKVYNLKGQVVDQFTLRNQESGFHRYTWEPQLGSGVYLIRFSADGVSNTRKVILSK